MWGTPLYGNSADSYAERGLTLSPEAKAKGGRGSRSFEAIARDGKSTNRWVELVGGWSVLSKDQTVIFVGVFP